MSSRCPTCGGSADYPMLVKTEYPQAICADEFHNKFFHKALGHRKPVTLGQRLKAAWEAFTEE